MCAKLLQLYLTLCDPVDYIAHQAPLSMDFSRQEYWRGLPGPPPGDEPDPGIEPKSLLSLALAGGFFITSTTWEAPPLIMRTMQIISIALMGFVCFRATLHSFASHSEDDIIPI